MRKKISFLTKKDFNIEPLIENLKKNFTIANIKDQKILKEILNLFEKKDFSLLSPQEIHFLNSN